MRLVIIALLVTAGIGGLSLAGAQRDEERAEEVLSRHVETSERVPEYSEAWERGYAYGQHRADCDEAAVEQSYMHTSSPGVYTHYTPAEAKKSFQHEFIQGCEESNE